MINSERELEDYICDNQDDFIKKLKEIYNIKEKISFVGRQVHIGENNIADLIYYYETNDKIKNEEGKVIDKINFKNFIIVELKFRELTSSDLAQISRYMTIFKDKMQNDEYYHKHNVRVYGILVGFDLDNNMQEIQIFLRNFVENEDCIKFIIIKSNITYEPVNYLHTDKYIKNIKLDERLLKIINE